MQAPRLGRLHLDPAACTFCGHNGGVQLCGICLLSLAQGNSPLGNQAQMQRKPNIKIPNGVILHETGLLAYGCAYRARMLENPQLEHFAN